jgi:hypothetical protein
MQKSTSSLATVTVTSVADGAVLLQTAEHFLNELLPVTTSESIYPVGFILYLGGVLASGNPMDQQFKVEAGVMLDGCGVGAQPFVQPTRDPDIKSYAPGAAGGAGAVGPPQCYTWWRGTEPATPTTKFSDCGGHMTWAETETCAAGETHCWYVESARASIDNNECNNFFGVGGCWSSLEAAWPQTFAGNRGDPPPARGPLADDACGQLAHVFIDTTWPAAACVGCEGSHCAREVLEWAGPYENFWRVPARALLATAGAGELGRRPRADTEEACKKKFVQEGTPAAHAVVICGADICQVDKAGDGVCDVEFNTLACGYDGGDCCVAAAQQTRVVASGLASAMSDSAFVDPEAGVDALGALEAKGDLVAGSDYIVPDPAPDKACTVPWLQGKLGGKKPWRFAVEASGAAFATMPHSFHRALRQRNAVERAGSHGVTQLSAAERAAMDEELLSSMPSLACPECPSYSRAENYRKVPFTVAVGNNSTGGNSHKMPFASMKRGDSRLRFLTKPNVVVFGPLVTTTRASMAKCDGDGAYGLLATQSDGKLCQNESGPARTLDAPCTFPAESQHLRASQFEPCFCSSPYPRFSGHVSRPEPRVGAQSIREHLSGWTQPSSRAAGCFTRGAIMSSFLTPFSFLNMENTVGTQNRCRMITVWPPCRSFRQSNLDTNATAELFGPGEVPPLRPCAPAPPHCCGG